MAEEHRERRSGIKNRTRFGYDKAENLVEIQDNQGRKTTLEYDRLNREIKRIERDGSVTRSFYNPNGYLVRQIRPNQYQEAGEKGQSMPTTCWESQSISAPREEAVRDMNWMPEEILSVWRRETITEPVIDWTTGEGLWKSKRQMAPKKGMAMTAPEIWSVPPMERGTLPDIVMMEKATWFLCWILWEQKRSTSTMKKAG